ncbi:MAG: DNA replication/repair protein RecF [Bacilli bacterium]|nr:DNA replication/repair protein RecF [Bacilli bacterium]
MIISKISLLNFRNYKKISLNLSENMNIFIGNNAQGKTNILESIYILALTKSHRLGVENNLIKNGSDFFKINGSIRVNDFIKKLEVGLVNGKKIVKINNNEIKKISDYISNLNIINFSPEDLDIIKGSPGIRRDLLNIEISQIYPGYIDKLNRFNKLLKIRNEYLKNMYGKNNRNMNYFEIINDKYIDLAIEIFEYRNDYIKKINLIISDIYENLTGMKKIEIEYINNFIDNKKDKVENFKNLLKKNIEREISQGMTLYGPHRDDLIFKLNNSDLKFFGSQGQQRLAIISFKLSEIKIFKELTGTQPILLLDDIFSELDISKRNKLIKYIIGKTQTIITTTDLKNINKTLVKNSKIFEVKNGVITER